MRCWLQAQLNVELTCNIFSFFFSVRGGDFIKSFVYGSMDGLITTFSVVAAVVGGDMEVGTVLVL